LDVARTPYELIIALFGGISALALYVAFLTKWILVKLDNQKQLTANLTAMYNSLIAHNKSTTEEHAIQKEAIQQLNKTNIKLLKSIRLTVKKLNNGGK